MMNAKQFIRWYIDNWEGGLSLDPKDRGNWWNGQLVGSQYGVTAAALSMYTKDNDITLDKIKAISKETATAIGYEQYFIGGHLDQLPWNAVTASLLDKEWGSGIRAATRLFQGMIKAPVDGIIGSETVAAYLFFLSQNGEEKAAIIWAKTRENFDLSLHQSRFLKGWNNRTEGFLPGTKFWELFHAK